jgi:protein O-GlcNAc transferase
MSRSLTALDPIPNRSTISAASNNNNTVSTQKQQQLPSFLSKAQLLYNGGNYSEALIVCEKIYEFDAHRTDNLLLMGAIHFQLRNYSESVFFNQQCIRVDPNFAEAYSNLGNALKELGDLKGATQFYSKVNLENYFIFLLYFLLKLYQNDQAIKLKPRFSDAYNNLASAYMLQGRVQQAMETYQMALVLNPNLVDAHTNLGNLYKATGDMEAAKQCYLEAIRINAEFAIAWNNLAGSFLFLSLPFSLLCTYTG